MAFVWRFISVFVIYTFAAATPSFRSGVHSRRWNHTKKLPQESHDLVIGQRQEGDQFMYQTDVIKPWKSFRVVVVEETFSVDERDNITLVRVLDKFTDGHGANPELIGGGPGFNNVAIRFTSQSWYGIDFLVEIYALVHTEGGEN
ncbi:hypothetical protein QAD02_009939 [Eretmocerus hayati]|uniref:Uncharacterized protein n=1 Tax=Eretmocerus hayati TaxID=131215 RepID=A0ACC2NC41_9HYME|nr:hypothetical protein QAD02_009939 [Eretmocerus hayati]